MRLQIPRVLLDYITFFFSSRCLCTFHNVIFISTRKRALTSRERGLWRQLYVFDRGLTNKAICPVNDNLSLTKKLFPLFFYIFSLRAKVFLYIHDVHVPYLSSLVILVGARNLFLLSLCGWDGGAIKEVCVNINLSHDHSHVLWGHLIKFFYYKIIIYLLFVYSPSTWLFR